MISSTNLAVRDPQSFAVSATVLGQSQSRFTFGGTIRPGIKVLTSKAKGNERALKIFDDGVAKGLSFDEIEAAITKAIPDLTTPLAPKNPPYFTVRPSDFANPAVADQLLKLYGEDKGEGTKLYRFPVIFVSDELNSVMPHTLQCWGSAGRKYWAEFDDDGERYCMQYAPPKVVDKKVVRVFGGRKPTRRPENEGRCDPENCREYQARECNLQGMFIVLVPGVESMSPIQIPTTSFYGLSDVMSVLRSVANMRGGRVSGMLDKSGTTFWMTKKLKDVSRIDDTGKATRTPQWIISIEAPVDVMPLLMNQATDEHRIAAADDAIEILTGDGSRAGRPANEVDDEDAGVADGDRAHDDAVDGRGRAEPSNGSAGGQAREQATANDERPGQASTAGSSGSWTAGQAGGPPDLVKLHQCLAKMQIPVAEFAPFAAKRWGAGWDKNPRGVKTALAYVETHVDDPASLKNKITQEVNVFS